MNKVYDYTISVLRDVSNVVYNDVYREAFRYSHEIDFEIQHKAMEVLQERGYVRYVRKKIDKRTEGNVSKTPAGVDEEVDQCFEEHKDDEIHPNQLDGPQTCDLARIQRKYKKKINEELGMDFYEDVGDAKKDGHRKFSDMIIV